MTFELLNLSVLLLLLNPTFAVPIADPEPQAPVPSPKSPFTLSVAHSHDTALNGQQINAADLSLFLGLASPSTFCPSPPVRVCPTGNETVFSSLLSMDVEVPGGQQAYVSENGALGYTVAHSAQLPPGAFAEGFTWSPLHTNSVLGQRGELDFVAPGAISGGFLACPVAPGATFQIFAQVPGFTEVGCVKLGKLRTTEFKQEEFGAWEYT